MTDWKFILNVHVDGGSTGSIGKKICQMSSFCTRRGCDDSNNGKEMTLREFALALLSQKQDSVDESPALVHQVSNESRTSITESLSEFFDAQEVLLSASSSENEVRVFSSVRETIGMVQSHRPAALMFQDVVDEIMVIAAGASATSRMLECGFLIELLAIM